MARGETWYRFMEVGKGELEGRLIVPRADPQAYEYPFDFLWESPEDARAYLQERVDEGDVEWEEAETWVLVREVNEVLSVATDALCKPEGE